MKKNHTTALRKAMDSGEVIVCSMAPYENWEMTYDPRAKGDPRPWTIMGTPFRYSGNECHAVTREELDKLTDELEAQDEH